MIAPARVITKTPLVRNTDEEEGNTKKLDDRDNKSIPEGEEEVEEIDDEGRICPRGYTFHAVHGL